MSKAVAPITALDAIDTDIREAIATRDVAFRKLMVRDDDDNRDRYREAYEAVDSLLDMRWGMAHDEGNRP